MIAPAAKINVINLNLQCLLVQKYIFYK